jgi:hypothetical protein
MTTDEWREMAVLSWMTMLMHSLKLGYFVMEWLNSERIMRRIDFLDYLASGPGFGPIAELVNGFYAKADRMLDGEGRGCVACGDIYWDVEEAAFIECMLDADRFFADMERVLRVPQSIISYQKSRIPPVSGDIESWATETIIFGRKSGTMLLPERMVA